ncbi:MAG: hypothetical protein JW787_08170 [Sedimentisphaerales bacterium]|nr:hypothetical protein [Sedimentisphaerales bacterium]
MKKYFSLALISVFISVMYFHEYTNNNCSNAQAEEVQKSLKYSPNEAELKKTLEEQLEVLRSKSLQEHKDDLHNPQVFDMNETDIEKKKANQIERINTKYKERVFGNPFNGLAMSIALEKEQFEIGEEIEIQALFKNLTESEIYLRQLDDGARDIRYGLYFFDGSPVPKSEYAEKFEASLSEPLQSYSLRGSFIKPKAIVIYIVPISKYFNIEKEGTYFLVMMRRITDSWEDGFMISNMTRINIVKKKTEKQG